MPRMQGTVYCVNMQSKSMCASAQNHISSPVYRTMGASDHIASCARNKDPMFIIIPFYKVKTEDRIFREKSKTIL